MWMQWKASRCSYCNECFHVQLLCCFSTVLSPTGQEQEPGAAIYVGNWWAHARLRNVTAVSTYCCSWLKSIFITSSKICFFEGICFHCIWKAGKVRETERQRNTYLHSLPRCLQQWALGLVQSRSLELSSGLLYGWQGTKSLGHP